MPSKTVVIFGATGAVGTSLAERLSADPQVDWKIQAVSRTANGSSRLEQLKLPRVHVVAGDPTIKEQVLALTKEADIVVSCIGLHKYQAKFWAQQWPVIVENLLAGTVQQQQQQQGGRRCRLVFCDNLYAYGASHDTPISTHTPTVTPSLQSKPQIRSLLRQTFQQHMKQHPGTLTVVGGADFFGPHVTATSFLGDTVTDKIVQGSSSSSSSSSLSPLAIGSATVRHDFCYVPDFAHALAVACTDDRALDKFWICPHAVQGKSMTDLAQDIARLAVAGQSTKPVSMMVLPVWVVYLLSPFMDFMWEMIEMLPFWTKDYAIDDSEFTSTFGIEATPYEQALSQLVAFYQTQKAAETEK